MTYGAETVVRRLREVGCEVSAAVALDSDDLLTVHPPSWRPDLTDPNDLAEEVIRLEGYERIGISDAAGHRRPGQDTRPSGCAS